MNGRADFSGACQRAVTFSASRSRISQLPSRHMTAFRSINLRIVLLVCTSESPSVSAICCCVMGICMVAPPFRPDAVSACSYKGEEIGRALDCRAPSNAQQIFVQHLLFPGGDPGDVEGKARMVAVKLVKLGLARTRTAASATAPRSSAASHPSGYPAIQQGRRA